MTNQLSLLRVTQLVLACSAPKMAGSASFWLSQAIGNTNKNYRLGWRKGRHRWQ